jgi:hypothetical protein
MIVAGGASDFCTNQLAGRGALTEVLRPRARQIVDVVGAPAYDPERPNGALT